MLFKIMACVMLNQLWDWVGINAFSKGRKIIHNRRGGLEHSFTHTIRHAAHPS